MNDNTQKISVGACVLGGLGGLMPTLVKIAPIYASNQAADPPALGLYIALGIFAVFGVVAVAAFQETVFLKALALGIAAPGILTNAVAAKDEIAASRSLTQHTSQTEDGDLLGRLFGVSSAYAQTVAPRPASASSRITVVPQLTGAPREYAVKPVTLAFVGVDGSVLGSSNVDVRSTPTLEVPRGATSVRALSDGKATEIRLPAGGYSSAELGLAINVAPGSDFSWALGGTRKANVQSINGTVRHVTTIGLQRGMSVVTPAGQQVGVVERVSSKPGQQAVVVMRPAGGS
ncbi:MAG TPA: hypothetical protein VMF52_21940 [Steroidobacteraceae bacterium]|nr:hypothetical protein [Steroidobacteraceae bacterium]